MNKIGKVERPVCHIDLKRSCWLQCVPRTGPITGCLLCFQPHAGSPNRSAVLLNLTVQYPHENQMTSVLCPLAHIILTSLE